MITANRRITSRLSANGLLTVGMEQDEIPPPGPGEVIVRIDGAPINPIDVKTLFCGIDPDDLSVEVISGAPRIVGNLAPERLGEFRSRLDAAVPAGAEGTGIVVAAGSGGDAQAAIGERVAVVGGAMFSEYCRVAIADCLILPAGTPVEAAAAASINPMTALAMLETMRGEGHSALCLTAAASNLGRMVNRLCLRDGVPLVNIVRSSQQVALLRGLGAECVLDSTEAHFDEALEAAMAATGATIAFDATGGGTLGGRILRAMDRSLSVRAPGQGRYGSAVHKQLYFFGGLNPEPVTFQRDFGMAWGMGGWLLQARLARLDPAQLLAMKQRVRDELSGIFLSSFGGSIGLGEMIVGDHVRRYANRGTGNKLLVRP